MHFLLTTSSPDFYPLDTDEESLVELSSMD